MKNGSQSKSSPPKTKSIQDYIHEYRQRHREDMSRVGVLLFLSLISALIIQDRIGLGYFTGSFLIIAVILFIFYKDIRRYKPAYLEDYKMMLLLGLLVTGTLLLGRIFEYLLSGLYKGLSLPDGRSFIFGIPIPMGAMLVTLIFDFHTAIIFSFLISLLTGIWLHDPFFPFYAFVGSLTAAFCVIRCKKSSALIKAGIYVSGVSIITAGIVMLLGGNLFSPTSLYSFYLPPCPGSW